MIREGSSWREVSWEDALDRAADGLRRVRKHHGRDAVAMYYGNPVAHNLGLMTHALPFARALRTRNVYSASSADQLPQMLAALRMFGHLALIPVPDLDRTDLLPGLRREPDGVERQPHDRPEHQGPAPRHSRSRRAHRRGRSAAHRDGGDRRRARRHPARDRRAAARGHAARRLRRRLDAPGAFRRPGEQPRRPRGLRRASSRRSASLAEPASTPRRRAGSQASSRARRAPRVTAASDCARSGTARWRRGWCRRSISSPVISTRSGA